MIQTDRLRFRTWSLDDLPLAEKLWGDPEVMKYIDVRGGLTREQLLEKLKKEIASQESGGTQYWPMFAGSDFVGCCGLKPWKHSERGGLEFGFHIVQSQWGRGYASEAARGVVSYAFRELRLPFLMAGHYPANEKSKKILVSLGFKYDQDVFFPPTEAMHPSYILRR